MRSKLCSYVVALSLVLPGCASLGGGENPTVETLQTVNSHLSGGVAALNAYCEHMEDDPEIAGFCAPALLTAGQASSAVDAAVAAIAAIMARRAARSTVREVPVCKPLPQLDETFPVPHGAS